MKPPARATIRFLPRLVNLPPIGAVSPPVSCRAAAIHTSSATTAKVVPIYGTGPPPEPPAPSEAYPDARIARRKRQAEMLRQAQDLRTAKGMAAARGGKSSPLKKRFWQDVHVKEVDGAYQVHLDARPLRHPNTKAIVRIPLSKPHLAHAVALEWDFLTSAQQATMQHLIPLTSLVCRAIDIADDDAAHASKPASETKDGVFAPVRTAIATMLLRYLDTDSLLCWAPESDSLSFHTDPETGDSLRSRQEQVAGEIVQFLTSEVWPGVEIEPVLDSSSIVPRGQKPGVREVVQGWVMGLEPWDLAGVERAALAGKGLLGAVRLVVEWSEGSAGRALGLGKSGQAIEGDDATRFGVEEAARVASVEVEWQTSRWGEVEDTHDVEKEDLRRQLGSVVLLVTGTGSGKHSQ